MDDGGGIMTKREAIEILKFNRDMCLFNPYTGEESPMSEECKISAEAFGIAINEFENNEWHDLRKNPDDLPCDKRCVLIAYANGSYYISNYDYVWNPFTNAPCKYKKWNLPQPKQQSSVIAWKEIEPVEE